MYTINGVLGEGGMGDRSSLDLFLSFLLVYRIVLHHIICIVITYITEIQNKIIEIIAFIQLLVQLIYIFFFFNTDNARCSYTTYKTNM